jgi:hypothetical protein
MWRGFWQSKTKNVKSKRRFAWCIECGSIHGTPMDGRDTKMLAHVMSAQCRRSAAEKAFYSQSVGKVTKKERVRSVGNGGQGDSSDSDVEEIISGQKSVNQTTEKPAKSPDPRQTGISTFMMQKMTLDKQNRLDRILTELFLTSNIPFAVVENKNLMEVVKELAPLCRTSCQVVFL